MRILSAIAFFCLVFVFCAGKLLGQNGKLVVQTGNLGKIHLLEFSDDATYLASVGEKSQVCIWKMDNRKQYEGIFTFKSVKDVCFLPKSNLIAILGDSKIEIWNYEEGRRENIIRTDDAKDIGLSPKGSLLVLSDRLQKWTGEKLEDIEGFKKIDFSQASEFEFSPDGNYTAFNFPDKKRVQIYSSSNAELLSTAKSKVNSFVFSEDSKTLFVAQKNATVVAIKPELGNKRKILLSNRISNDYLDIDLGASLSIAVNKNGLVTHFLNKTGRVLKNIKNDNFPARKVAISKKGDLVAIASENGLIRVWDFLMYEHVFDLKGFSSGVSSIEIDELGDELYISYLDGNLRRWNLVKNELSTTRYKPKFTERIRNFQFTPYLIERNKEGLVVKYLVKKPSLLGKSVKKSKQHFLWDLETLALQKVYSSKFLGDLSEREIQNRVDDASSLKEKLNLPENVLCNDDLKHPESGHIFLAGNDGVIYSSHPDSLNYSIKLLTIGNGFMYLTPENYYYASKSALSSVGYKLDGQLLSFEQSDLKYNRPDIVLSNLPYHSEQVISTLEKAYSKRLEKLGLNTKQLNNPKSPPTIKVISNKIPEQSSGETLLVKFEAHSSDGSTLKALHVLVNGVPMFDEGGFGISGKMAELEVEVLLSEGENKIQYYAVDQNGFSSVKPTIVTTCNRDYQPKLFVLGIGAGTFMEGEFDLNYAAKDAKDIVSIFEKSNKFKNPQTSFLVGEEVNRNNVEKELDKLANVDRDDLVIIFYAGHGLIDSKLDYYLSTYETSFSSPNQGSFSYEWFEQKLDKIKSRKKVVMIDACHSGEIDKKEMTLSTNKNIVKGTVKFRSVGVAVNSENALSFSSTLELSKHLFADMRQSNGSVVISSAGGGEFAIEGGNWQNGVFTYCILNGLRTKSADFNGDGKIQINELQSYLKSEVPKLTNGMQTPTFRLENLNQNFVIW